MPPVDERSFAAALKAWARREQLTQRQAAARLGVSWRSYQNWTGGQVIPLPKHRERIARVTGLEIQVDDPAIPVRQTLTEIQDALDEVLGLTREMADRLRT